MMCFIWRLVIISAIIVLFIFLFDIIQVLILWQSRIHIGRWTNREIWRQSVEKIAKRWLKHTPLVPKSDNDRMILWDIMRGKYCSRTIQSWQTAALLLGLEDSYSTEFMTSGRLDSLLQKTEIDVSFLLYALKIKGLIVSSFESELRVYFEQYESKTIPYRESLPNIRFVDSIGLICPLLYSIGMKGLANRQIEEFDRVLYNGVFPPHAIDIKTFSPLGVYDWGRGLGWYILGLISFDNNRERIIKLADKLLTFQREDGSFGCFVFSPYSVKESSITTLAGLLFIKAYELTNKRYLLDAALLSEQALMSMTRRNGIIDFAQGDTKGIGFYSTRFNRMPFVQGMALFFSKQLDRYIN